MSPRKLHGLRLVDLSPVLQVLLVPQEDDDGVPPAVELQLKEPLLQPGEGAPVSQIKDQHSALGPSEVSLGDGAEPGEQVSLVKCKTTKNILQVSGLISS